MSTLLRSKGRNRSSQQFIPEYRDYLNPFNKTNSIYYRDTIKQLCLHQRFVYYRSNYIDLSLNRLLIIIILTIQQKKIVMFHAFKIIQKENFDLWLQDKIYQNI